MKKILLSIAFFCPLALSAQQILDIGIFNSPVNSDKLEIRIKPTQTVSSGAYTAGVFTVRFLSSYGVTLTAPAALNNPLFRYAIANQGTDGTYSYYSLSFVSPFTVNWASGVEYPIAVLQINAGCGSGNGVFEIVNNAWTQANNGNVYQELNGNESQNIIYQSTANAPLGQGMLDLIPPTIICPANKTTGTDLNHCYHTHNGTDWDAIGSDNCPGFIVRYILSGATVDTLFTLDHAVFNKGLTTLNVTITDGAGLMASCSFTVTVNDIQAPAIFAPAAISTAANTSSCSVSGLVLGLPISSDNCPSAVVTNNAPSTFPLGVTTVTWKITDAAGQTATATQTVTVQSSLAANALNLSNHQQCGADTVNLSFTINGGVGHYSLVYSANGNNDTLTGYTGNQAIALTPTSTTIYKLVSVSDSIGCTLTPLALVDTLTVLPAPTLSSLMPSDTSVCQGDSVSFTAKGLLPNQVTTFHYTLQPGGPTSQTGTTSATGTFMFSPVAQLPGIYAMSIQSITVNGCTSNYSTGNSGTYSVHANPSLNSLVASATTVCQGDTVLLTANGLIPNVSTTFQYTLQPGGPASQTGISTAAGTYTFTAATNLPGVYSMSIQSIVTNGCTTNFSSGNSVTYTVNANPTLSSLQASATSVCQGEPVSFTANGLQLNASNTFHYTLTPGGQAVQSGLSSAAGSFTFGSATNPPGVYGMSIQSITVNGCTTNFNSSNSGTYTVSPFPTIGSSISPSANVVCSGTPVSILASGLAPDVLTTFQYTLNGVPGSTTVLSVSTGMAILLSAVYPEGNYTVVITSVTVAGCSISTNLSTTFTVDPFQAMCGFRIGGKIALETGGGVEEARVSLTGIGNSLPFAFIDFTDTLGVYSFVNTIPPASNYTLRPLKTDNPLNGVTTYDLVLISKHILGVSPLGSPYKMIAADANRSNSITTFDIVEFRKLILGIYQELPNNNSWRFVDKEYMFPDTNNPFVPIPLDTIRASNVQANALAEDFVGIKVGDVNGTVTFGTEPIGEERAPRKTLWLEVSVPAWISNTGKVNAGDTFQLLFTPGEFISGYQFTLDLMNLEVLDISASGGMSADHFGVFPDAVTGSFVSGSPGQTGAFSITFRALTNGVLNQMLTLSNRITRTEAYSTGSDMAFMAVNLHFEGIRVEKQAFELYQNQPNPFVGTTIIPFYLPEVDEVKLSLFDEFGALIYTEHNSFGAGRNTFLLDGGLFKGNGLFWYKVETATASAVKKLLKH